MVILAIDPGTKLGWALGRDGKLIESGVEDLSVRRGESAGARFLRFRRWLSDGFVAYPPNGAAPFLDRKLDLLIYEQAHHRGGAATEVCVGLTTRCQEFAAEHGIECVGIHTGTLKKRATGSGAATKWHMREAAWNRWSLADRWKGFRREADAQEIDDNEADALCLLWLGFQDYSASSSSAASSRP